MDNLGYLRPGFNPKSRSVTINDLQNIFIDHGVRYNRAKTKADYIALYEEHILPQAPRLLAQAERVRASSVGIEDKRLTASTTTSKTTEKAKPRKPLVPSQRQTGIAASKSSSRISAEPVENGRALQNSRKAASMNNLAVAAASENASRASGSRAKVARQPSVEPPRRFTRRSVSVELEPDTEEDELAMDVDNVEEDRTSSRHAARRASGRKVSQVAAVRAAAPIVIEEDDDDEEEEEEDELMEDDEVPVPPQKALQPASRQSSSTSPMRRPVVEMPVPHRRRSDIDSPQKRKKPEAEEKPVAESPFTSYNPFQSSPDEDTKAKRRRKSSMGVKREASPELSSIKRSKNVADVAMSAENEGTPSAHPRKSKSSQEPPMPSDGLERFKRRISGVPDSLPSPLRRNLSPTRDSDSKPRPSFASLAMAPEDFEVTAYTSPRKEKHRSTSPEKAKPAASRPVAVFEPESVEQVQESSAPEYFEEEQPVYQSQIDDLSDDSEDGPEVAASTSALQRRQVEPSGKRGPAPPVTRDLVRAAALPAAKVSKELGRKSLQASGFVTALLMLATIWQSAVVWADGKRALGFCDTGEDFNEAVIRRQDQSALIRHRDLDLQNWQETLVRARDFVAPLTCTPCPEQGVCENGKMVKCNQGYIEKPSTIASLVFNEQQLLDSSRSVLPLVFTPKCVPDGAYLRRVLEIASESSSYLRRTKGDLYCSGHPSKRIREAKKLEINGSRDAYVFGVPESKLRETVAGQLNIDAGEQDFDTKFTEALDYLDKHSEIVRGVYDNQVWLAAIAADMPLSCKARLAAYSVADEHKGLLSLMSAILALLGYGRHSIQHRRGIEEEVEELVPLSLSLLQSQAQNYSLRDSMTPEPYLAPAQLRDLVLRDEKSASRKAELWKKVEKAVEKNANVRARMAEQHGEEIRVWQWVGGAYETDLPVIEAPPNGAPASTNRRRSYAALAPRPSLSRPGTPRVSMGADRHITWDENVSPPAA